MKRIMRRISGCFLCIIFCFLLTACFGSAGPVDYVHVTVVDNELVVSETYVRAERRSDVELELTIAEGYGFEGCSYLGDYSVSGYTGEIVLRLHDVKYDVRLDIQAGDMENAIYYHLNGGEFCDSNDQGEYYIRFADLSHHLRANTDIATGTIHRDGYTQIGWNTEPDGSGERIGLGSRVTAGNGALHLYAQWVQWTDDSVFQYEYDTITADPDDIVLTGYSGDHTIDSLVIPAEIDGAVVSGIWENFAQGLTIQELILPNTIMYVERNAFVDTEIQEICFFDNLETIYDKSFSSGIRTVHINAVLAPRYSTDCDHAQFTENMDRLILNADNKKMIFFAGCSMSYGLRSDMVEEAFAGEYVVMNMGVIGGTNAAFQFDCITAYLSEGDVLVHAPEEMSEYQLMHNVRSEVRIFYCVESNYDLLALADFSETELFFNNFTEYNRGRLQAENVYTYLDYNTNYNEYGDYAVVRENSPEGTSFEIVACFLPDCVNVDSVARLNEKYDRIAEKGATVFFSFAPINEDAIPEEEQEVKSWEIFEKNIRNGLNAGHKVISSVEDYMMPGQYFYDEDYHLTDEGAVIRTKQLIEDLKAALPDESRQSG